MQKAIHNLKWLTLSIAMGIVIGGGLIAVKAWTEPTAVAPGGNVGAPINTSNISQIKQGNLSVNTSGSFAYGLLVPNGNVGIGTINPTQKLDVNGTIRSTGLQLTTGAAAGRILTSDASGNATWQTGGSGWPAGSYCIMKNGVCPSGFTAKTLASSVARPEWNDSFGSAAASSAGSSTFGADYYGNVHYHAFRMDLAFCCK